MVVNKSGRIAKNTTLLYLRMIVVMLINLYAVRVVYNSLGAEDYGIYNVTAGVVSLLAFVTGVLSMSTQRYYSVALGENENKKIREVFSSSINIFIYLTIGILIVGETLGLWFVYNKLGIPDERLTASVIVYQFALVSFIFSLFQIPYSAATIAYEDMGVYALLTTIECILKLAAALVLLIIPFDKLVIYGIALCLAHFIALLLFGFYGRKKYSECRYEKVTNKNLYKEYLSFSGWTLFGSVANVGMIQGNTILVNIFFGPVITAARSISLQIYNALSTFCNSFVMAIRPPMIKTYTEGEDENLLRLFDLGNKFIYYCLLMLCLPLILEMEYILSLWLGNVDFETVYFSKLIIIYTIIISLHNPITIIIQAIGKVKQYYLPVETFTLLTVPLTYVFYKLGFPAEYTFWIMIGLGLISHIVRIICLKKLYSPFKAGKYLLTFVAPAIVVTILSVFVLYKEQSFMQPSFWRLICVTMSSIALVMLLAYLLGLTRNERDSVNRIVSSYLKFNKKG